MSTHNIGFYEDLTKIIFELSSNTHLIISSADFSLSGEQIRCIFDDNWKIILATSFSPGDSNEHPQHRFL